MSEETIVGIYDTAARAEAAAADLRSAGIAEGAITVNAQAASTSTTTGTTTTPVRETGFWAGLLGGESERDTAVYDRILQGGSAVVTVRLDSAHADRVMAILERHNPIDVEERAASYGLAQTETAAVAGAGTLQLAEEQLSVGKRVVNRGGTRIRRYVVETPVERSVSLHEEKVTLERRPVTDGRPVTDSFSEKTMELTETAEEAVVAKTARIYEEVGLRKEATERVETVRDTVRKEEVEVEQIPSAATTTTTRVSDINRKV